METRGPQTQAPRAALPHDVSRTNSVIWGVAFGLSALIAVGQIMTLLVVAPAAIEYAGTGNAFVGFVDSLGPLGFGAFLSVVDVLTFFAFAWLARRYWVGFLFLPPLVYLGAGSLALALLLSDALRSLAGI